MMFWRFSPVKFLKKWGTRHVLIGLMHSASLATADQLPTSDLDATSPRINAR
jgi:hypothetical protein